MSFLSYERSVNTGLNLIVGKAQVGRKYRCRSAVVSQFHGVLKNRASLRPHGVSILGKDLGLHPYKIKLTQELKPIYHLKRRTFSDWALEMIRHDDKFHRKIIFSDKVNFWLKGFVKKQNMRYWSDKNPHLLHESPVHPQKITAGGAIGPYFFVDDNDRHVTVNGQRYRAMATDYFWPELKDMDLSNMWFQQDGATSHTAHLTIDLLKSKFDERCYLKKWASRLAASFVRFNASRLFSLGLR